MWLCWREARIEAVSRAPAFLLRLLFRSWLRGPLRLILWTILMRRQVRRIRMWVCLARGRSLWTWTSRKVLPTMELVRGLALRRLMGLLLFVALLPPGPSVRLLE